MPGLLVHVGALTKCPHPPGAVTPTVTGPPRVLVNGGQQVLTSNDAHTVAGCTFQIPFGAGTKPQPCVTVRLESATRVFVNNVPAVILTSGALCYSSEQIAQGPPDSSRIQNRVTAT